VKVKDPQGRTWRVSRRWVPWRRRLKGWVENAPDMPALGDDPISLVIGLVLLVLLLPLVVVALVAALELLLLLLVLPFAVLLRVVLGRHWTVETRWDFHLWWEGPGGTWRESRAAIAEVAEAIQRGEVPLSNIREPRPPGSPGPGS